MLKLLFCILLEFCNLEEENYHINSIAMLSINLTEVNKKEQIAKIIHERMDMNGITKSELILGTHLSKTAINSVLIVENSKKDYLFGTLLKVLDFLKIKIYIGKNEETKSKVLSLF